VAPRRTFSKIVEIRVLSPCRLPESGESLRGLWIARYLTPAGRTANESLESLGALQGLPGSNDVYRSTFPCLDCDIFPNIATKTRRAGIDSAREGHQNVSSYTLVCPRSLLGPEDPPRGSMTISIISPIGAS
jgi:hypothetical protein